VTPYLRVALVASLSLAFGGPLRADDKDDKKVTAILDKAVKALGGEAKLSKPKGFTWKSKGTITFNSNDSEFTGQATLQGLDHFRSEFEGKFGDNDVKGVTVLSGKKGWRKFGDVGGAMSATDLANEKRNVYLQYVPMTILPLKGKGFKVKLADEEKVNDKPAIVLSITGPDGKDFKLYLDKQTHLPVKTKAKVAGFMNDEFELETFFSGYKEFGGIKKATKLESKRDGEKFLSAEITKFEALQKVDEKTFAEPE